MIFLIRLYPRESAKPIWEFVHKRLTKINGGKVRPILASEQINARFVTLYVMSDDIEAVGDFIVKDLGTCKDIESTMTIPLLKMVFLPIPRQTPPLQRYSIMIHCNLAHYFSAFRSVIDLDPGEGLYPTFSAFLLGNWDIMLSMCAESRDRLEQFVEKQLKEVEGVRGVDIFPIEKSFIVCSEDDWKRVQSTLMYLPCWITEDLAEETEFCFYLTEEDISISGMLEH